MRINNGTILNERYEILAHIGEGGFASVYRGHDCQLDRDVAVKVLKMSPFDNNLPRFQREAKLLAQLSHRNIVSVYAYGLLEESTPFIVMEHLQGKSLQSLLTEHGWLDYHQTMTIVSQCCEGLSYAHKAGVVHRDLSPANVFIEGSLEQPTVKLLDFGLSRLFSSEAGQCATLTETGVLLGNPLYMSPELARGLRVDLRSDIYSLGCVLYYCICGKQAYSADSAVDLLRLHQVKYPREPAVAWKDAENGQLAKSIALRCLQKNPDKRFQSCDELLLALATTDPHRREQMDAELELWSDSRPGKKNKLSGSTKLCMALATMVLFVLVLLLLLPFMAGALFCSLPATTQASFAEPEQALAEYLRRSSSTFGFADRKAKVSILKRVFSRLGEVNAAKRSYGRSASCSLSEAEICLQEGDKEGFAEAMRHVLSSSRAFANSRDSAFLLPACWKLIQKALPADSASNDFLDMQIEVFDQMLSCGQFDRVEVQRCFDIILTPDRHYRDLDASTKKELAQSTIKFLTEIKPKLNESESQALDFFTRICPESNLRAEAEILWRTRLSISHNSGENAFALKLKVADYLSSVNPDETLRLLSELRNLETDKIMQIASTWDLESIIRLNCKNDYLGALHSSEQGLKVLKQISLITYNASRNSKLRLTLTHIRALFKLGRQQEMALCTEEVLKALWARTPDVEAASNPVYWAHKTFGRGPESSHSSFQLVEQFQQDFWFPCLTCLIETNQKPAAVKALSYLLARLRQDHWQLDPKVKSVLTVELASVADPELSRLLRQILEMGKN